MTVYHLFQITTVIILQYYLRRKEDELVQHSKFAAHLIIINLFTFYTRVNVLDIFMILIEFENQQYFYEFF